MDRTLVLETEFRTGAGTVVLQDVMPAGISEHGHELGSAAPHAVLRCVSCTAGDVEMEIEYAPRAEYGLVTPLLTRTEGGAAGRVGATVLLLSAPIELTIADSAVRARFTLRVGEAACFALQHRSISEPAPRHLRQPEIRHRIADTTMAWQSWSALHQQYDGPMAGAGPAQRSSSAGPHVL